MVWSTEEHIVLVEEPNSQYLGHTVFYYSTAALEASVILSFSAEQNIDLNYLNLVGCDGCAVNTEKIMVCFLYWKKNFRCLSNGRFVFFMQMSCHSELYSNTLMEIPQVQMNLVVKLERH